MLPAAAVTLAVGHDRRARQPLADHARGLRADRLGRHAAAWPWACSTRPPRPPPSTTWRTARSPVPPCSCWPTSSPAAAAAPATGWSRPRPSRQLDLLAGLFFLGRHRHDRPAAAVGLHRQAADPGDATREPAWPWLWAVVLVGSLLAMIGFARAGSVVFWKCEAEPRQGAARPARAATWRPCAPRRHWSPRPILLAIFAGPAMTAMDATARSAVQARTLHRGRARQPHPAGGALTPCSARFLPAPPALPQSGADLDRADQRGQRRLGGAGADPGRRCCRSSPRRSGPTGRASAAR